MVKAASIDKNGFKKGAWSPEEDDTLRAYIVKHGHLNWRELPKFAGLSRCGKSCRLRWMNYLRPDVKRGNFSKEEDDLIIQLHQQLGNKWSKIATNLPGRTDNEIKNHWHTSLKKRVIMQIQTAHKEVAKQHYNETPKAQEQYKAKQLKPETSVSNAAFYPTILESFPMMSSEVSDCSYSAVAGVNWMAENNLPSSVEIFEESGEDFWTQPFVVDDYNTHSYDDYILSYNSYYDSMDLIFHQAMHELQENIYSYGN